MDLDRGQLMLGLGAACSAFKNHRAGLIQAQVYLIRLVIGLAGLDVVESLVCQLHMHGSMATVHATFIPPRKHPIPSELGS